MEKIDFLKKGITDFFPNFFITFSKVQRNIFNEKSHSNRKTNLKVDLVSCVTGMAQSANERTVAAKVAGSNPTLALPFLPSHQSLIRIRKRSECLWIKRLDGLVGKTLDYGWIDRGLIQEMANCFPLTERQ